MWQLTSARPAASSPLGFFEDLTTFLTRLDLLSVSPFQPLTILIACENSQMYINLSFKKCVNWLAWQWVFYQKSLKQSDNLYLSTRNYSTHYFLLLKISKQCSTFHKKPLSFLNGNYCKINYLAYNFETAGLLLIFRIIMEIRCADVSV